MALLFRSQCLRASDASARCLSRGGTTDVRRGTCCASSLIHCSAPPFQFLSLQEALLVGKGVVANSWDKQVGEDWSMAAGNRAWRSQGPAQSLVEGSVETWSDSEDSPDLPGSHESRLSPPACARVGGRRTDESPELWIHLQDSHSRSR